jgi:hypothetical protein
MAQLGALATDHCYPWGTGEDGWYGHAEGVAGKDEVGWPGGDDHQLDRRVRPVLGDTLLRSQRHSMRGSRIPYGPW